MPERDENAVRLIHERSRFLILTRIAGSDTRSMNFTGLKDELNLTAGNLSMHLKSLQEAGLIDIEKKFVGNKPLTTVFITEKGISILDEYLSDMEKIIRSLRKG